MDMTPIQWVLIVLLVLLIAVGVFMLTRKPAARQDRNKEDGQISSEYGPGGEHVAAGDAGATPSAPLYDQEAEADVAGSSVEDDPIEAPVWEADDSLGQDTATGADVEVIEEEPVISATEDVEPMYAATDSSGRGDRGDREQMAYGDPQTEDFASETVYAEAPVEDDAAGSSDHVDFVAGPAGVVAVDDLEDGDVYAGEDPDTEASEVETGDVETGDVPDAVVVDESDDVPEDAAAAGFLGATGATAMGSQFATDDDESADVDAEVAGVIDIAEPAPGDADTDEVVVVDNAADDPIELSYDDASVVEPTGIEIVEPEAVGDDQPQAVMVDVNDYGTHESVQPDHDSEQHEVEQHDTAEHPTEEDTYAPVAAEEDHPSEVVEHPAAADVAHGEFVAEETAYAPVVAEDQHLETAEEQPGTTEDESVEEPNPLIEASPYGAGSAIPDDAGQGPDGYEIKGNAGSMLFHTPESPSYGECTPEVFFENEDAARAAGFAHWDRKRR